MKQKNEIQEQKKNYSMGYTIYGIKNCGSVKKAFDYFEAHGITYSFFDYKKTTPTVAQLTSWCEQKGWETILNRKGTTWRKLTDDVKASVIDIDTAVTVMQEHLSTIKRPIIENEKGEVILVGFDEATYNNAL